MCGIDGNSTLLELFCFVRFEFDEPNELLSEVEGETYARVRANGACVALDTTYPEAFWRFRLFCADMYAHGTIGIQHATNRFSPILQWLPRGRICGRFHGLDTIPQVRVALDRRSHNTFALELATNV